MNQTVLATPETSEGWLESLSDSVTLLERQLQAASADLRLLDAETANSLLRGFSESLQTVVEALRANGRRIADEAGKHRATADAERAQTRLRQLIDLHDSYLAPVIDVIDVRGDFVAATIRVSDCCARLRDLCGQSASSVAETAGRLRREVVGFRQNAIRAAEDAHRELGPLSEATHRESRIAVGVHRALDAIELGQWDRLALDEHLAIVDDRDGPLFSDTAVERHFEDATIDRNSSLQITHGDPESLEIPVTVESLIDRLEQIESVDDLLAWILDVCDWIELDQAVRLLHSVIERRPDRVHPTDVRSHYAHDGYIAQATRWYWGEQDANERAAPERPSDAEAIGRSVPIA